MAFKKHLKKKRLIKQLYIKLGIIKAGNNNPILKNDAKKIMNEIKTLSL